MNDDVAIERAAYKAGWWDCNRHHPDQDDEFIEECYQEWRVGRDNKAWANQQQINTPPFYPPYDPEPEKP